MGKNLGWAAVALSAAAFGCGSSDSGGGAGMGGAGGAVAPSNGGTTSSGGIPSATGGSTGNTGGVSTSSGGSTGTGGATPSGGGSEQGTGGIGSGGAAPATGGASTGGGASGFPPASDPGQAGTFETVTVNNAGPESGYTAIRPKDLGKDGLKHPIVIWGNGAVMSPPLYATLLNHIASHGFAILAYNTTPQGAQMTAPLDWMIAENGRQGSEYAGKLDTTKIAAMGHSAGSVATFQIAADERLTTTMHLNGGTFDPHTELKNLKKPAAFICGDSGGDGLLVGDVARANCDFDFANATTPVWYGDVIGASHLTLSSAAATDPKMAKGILAATVGWLRWQLMGDQSMKKYFAGADCEFCKDKTIWAVQQKNLP